MTGRDKYDDDDIYLAVDGRLDAIIEKLGKDPLSSVQGNLKTLSRQVEEVGCVAQIGHYGVIRGNLIIHMKDE